MIKQLVALASVTALSGLVAAAGVVGCSSDSDATTLETAKDGGAGSGEAKTDSGTPTPGEGHGDDDPSSRPPSCYAASNFQMPAQYAYQKAGPKIPNACTEEQIYAFSEALRAAEQKPEVDFTADIAPAIGTTGACVDCIHGSATEWRAYNDKSLFNTNQLGCLEVKGAITTACASARYNLNTCVQIGCNGCVRLGQREADACVRYANAHDCGKIDMSACDLSKDLEELIEENHCGDDVNIANNFCGSGTALTSDGGL